MKTLADREQRGADSFNNWLLIFNWNVGSFVSCEIISSDPEKAAMAYRDSEERYKSEEGFEVVLIGSSDIATVRETHSHYFGVQSNEDILENLDASVVGFTQKMDIDVGARQILLRLHTRRVWGSRAISKGVIKNHLCKNVMTFDSSLDALVEKGLVIEASLGEGLLLNMKRKAEIEAYIHA